MIELLQERIFKIEEFRKMEKSDLKALRDEVSNTTLWLISSEYYDKEKVANLIANEKKILKVFFEDK